MAKGWKGYEGEAAEALAARYEALRPAEVHSWLADLLPPGRGTVLDVGAGSGRDAAWLASMGYDVVAAEPSADMRAIAARLHPLPNVHWVDDALPGMEAVHRLGMAFDLILLSAVWMHVAPVERARAMRKLVCLLKPGGVLAVTLRHGPPEPGREMHPVSAEEIEFLAKTHGVPVVREAHADDRMGRDVVSWTHIAFRLPDDGTGALPLLRHVILNDQKSATYKLGLLRAVARAADGAQGMARQEGDGHVSVPLGLIALNWLRLYRPLVDAGLPQSPTNTGPNRLGFAKTGWAGIAPLAPLDLRVGASFTGGAAEALHAAIRDAATTITDMPATFMTFPGTSDPIMKAERSKAGQAPDRLLIDEPYLRRFGELRVPLHLWRALARYDAWIEPALVGEWIRLMKGYAERQGRLLDPAEVARAMEWSEPSRDVGLVRRIAAQLADRGPLFCVWTGKRLKGGMDVDHCIPWAAWACDDLFNLMPADPRTNRHGKRGKLPSAAALVSARERILGWWEAAYLGNGEGLATRFLAEAASSLPVEVRIPSLDQVYEGLAVRRMAIRADQQVDEWTP